jgi:translocation and assembly module TamB
MKIDRPLQGDLRLDGHLSLSDAALDVGLPFGPTETAAEIRFAGSRVEIGQLAGKIGGGTFEVGGVADLVQGPDLSWQVREMSTGMVPSVEHELSGDGTLRGSWKELTVAGRIDILRALYEKRIDISSFLPSFRRELARAPDTEPSAPATIVHLDLHIVASDELYIDNNFARVEAAADLKVTGESSNPRLGGQVQALSGEVFFKDRTFQITTAVADFRPELGFVASLNITAETDIVTTDGPSLTQNDVASLIAFGKTVAQLQEEGGGVAVSDVLMLAPGGYPERVEKKAATLLRLDRVDIEPTFSRTTGEFEPQLILGKNFGENFSTSLAATFGATQSQILRATYLLTPRFSLLATFEPESQNRDQAVGGGLRYRRTFRDTRGFSLLELGDRGSTKDAPP